MERRVFLADSKYFGCESTNEATVKHSPFQQDWIYILGPEDTLMDPQGGGFQRVDW